MAKKKELIQDVIFDDVPKLTAAQYWEWRNTCTELWLSNNKVKLEETQAQVLKKDVEIANMRLALHLAKVQSAKEDALNASENYRKIKDVLEGHLGTSLNDKVIDDVTYEVKEAPKAT
jgi:hypothetical protein